MSEQAAQQNDQLELVDMDITRASANHMRSLFDSYFKEGKYGLEDAQKLVISINNIYKALDTLNKLQELALRLKRSQEQLKQQSLAKTVSPAPKDDQVHLRQNNQVTGMPNVEV